jgi:hypothetical protein
MQAREVKCDRYELPRKENEYQIDSTKGSMFSILEIKLD